MRLPFLLLLAAAAAEPGPPPAAGPPVHFTGRTTADQVLIRDALRNILLFGSAHQDCTSLSAVEASILPADYAPANPKYRVTEAKVTFERWDATLCGRVTPFLVGFWPSPEGGTMFNVSYPYPSDAPRAEPPR